MKVSEILKEARQTLINDGKVVYICCAVTGGRSFARPDSPAIQFLRDRFGMGVDGGWFERERAKRRHRHFTQIASEEQDVRDRINFLEHAIALAEVEGL